MPVRPPSEPEPRDALSRCKQAAIAARQRIQAAREARDATELEFGRADQAEAAMSDLLAWVREKLESDKKRSAPLMIAAPLSLESLRSRLEEFYGQWCKISMPCDPQNYEVPAEAWRDETSLRQWVAEHRPLLLPEQRRKAADALAKQDSGWSVDTPAEEIIQDFDTLRRTLESSLGDRFHAEEERVGRTIAECAIRAFLDDFAPLAYSIVTALGAQRFGAEPYPEPAPIPECDPADLAKAVFGVASNSTLEAGKRCLLWGAMASNPAAFFLPVGWGRKVESWAAGLVIPLEQRNGWRTMRQPIEWALAAFDGLAAERSAATPASFAALEETSRQRAAAQRDAADRSWRELQNRDRFEAAWEDIYVPAPAVGQPVDYSRWCANIVAFAGATKEAGAAELFLHATPERQDERDALSVIQAALTGGAEALGKRLLELDGAGNGRDWKRVFNHNELFWRTIGLRRVAPVVKNRPDETAENSGPEAPSGFLGGAELADALGVNPSRRDAFFKKLERKRTSLGDGCWQEVSNKRPNDPKFQYRPDSPALLALAAAYKNPKPA
ncbi:MAG TPA: hypothetical protein VMV10_08205 [Pirellulales bacterium]|nr:hypothetical protein [Pirellulales bacterium]